MQSVRERERTHRNSRALEVTVWMVPCSYGVDGHRARGGARLGCCDAHVIVTQSNNHVSVTLSVRCLGHDYPTADLLEFPKRVGHGKFCKWFLYGK